MATTSGTISVVKNAVIVSCCSTILFVSQTLCGNVHDKRIADENYTIPPGIVLYQYSGYQGFRPEGVTIIQPTKKPKRKPLTEEQKDENRKISSVRVLIEHVIGNTKKCRIVKDECRLRKNDFVKCDFSRNRWFLTQYTNFHFFLIL
ncbi:MAG: hypothetical protein LBS79_11795 [Tannerella sp.]|jgi:hypothetical protein|nr:hypothetical protein [Tannerella sp.]